MINTVFSLQKGEKTYLPFQDINKNIKQLFQDRYQRNIWSVRNVQKILYQYKSLFINLEEISFHVALEALGSTALRSNIVLNCTCRSVLYIGVNESEEFLKSFNI